MYQIRSEREQEKKKKKERGKKSYSTDVAGLTVMAHNHSTGVGEAGTQLGALSVAVVVVGAHARVASQGVAFKGRERGGEDLATHGLTSQRG